MHEHMFPPTCDNQTWQHRDVAEDVVDRRRARLVTICEDLPEAVVEGDQHLKFSVRAKAFAYYLDDHHGDGIVAVTFKAEAGVQTSLVAAGPARFYVPSYLGPRNWVALRLDLDNVDWDEVAELVVDSYRLVAPKRLVARMEDVAP